MSWNLGQELDKLKQCCGYIALWEWYSGVLLGLCSRTTGSTQEVTKLKWSKQKHPWHQSLVITSEKLLCGILERLEKQYSKSTVKGIIRLSDCTRMPCEALECLGKQGGHQGHHQKKNIQVRSNTTIMACYLLGLWNGSIKADYRIHAT